MPENLNQQRCLIRFYLMRHVVQKGEFLYKMKKVLAFGLRKIFSLQTELLQKFWANLRSGGELIYSTCTLAPEENEMIIVNFLEKNVDAQILPISLSCKNEAWWKSNIANFGNNDFSSLNGFGIRILPSEYTE